MSPAAGTATTGGSAPAAASESAGKRGCTASASAGSSSIATIAFAACWLSASRTSLLWRCSGKRIGRNGLIGGLGEVLTLLREVGHLSRRRGVVRVGRKDKSLSLLVALRAGAGVALLISLLALLRALGYPESLAVPRYLYHALGDNEGRGVAIDRNGDHRAAYTCRAQRSNDVVSGCRFEFCHFRRDGAIVYAQLGC